MKYFVVNTKNKIMKLSRSYIVKANNIEQAEKKVEGYSEKNDLSYDVINTIEISERNFRGLKTDVIPIP